MAEVKPNTAYQWKEDEVFTLSGKEYETVINTLNILLSTPEAQKTILLYKANEILYSKLVKAIEEDKAFEATPVPDPSSNLRPAS